MQSENFPIPHSLYPKVIKCALRSFCVCALFGNLCMLSFASFSSNGNSNAFLYQGLRGNKFRDIHVEINEDQPSKNKQRLFTLRLLKEGNQTPSPGFTGDSEAGRRV